MKRRISLLLVIALLVSMVHLPVTAAGTQVRAFMNVDGAYFTSRTEEISFIPEDGDKDVRNEALGSGDLGSIFGLGYRYFHIQGWVADDDEFGDFGYSINGGDIVWGAGYSAELGLNSAAGYAYCLRYNLTLDVQEGNVTIKFFKMLSTGETRESKTLTYSNEASAPVVDHSGSHADTNIQVGEALLEADFSDSVLDPNQFVAWVNGYTIQNGALHLGYNGSWVDTCPSVRTAETFTNYFASFKMFGDKRDCYYGFGLRCDTLFSMINGGRFGVPVATEQSVGIAVDIFGAGNSTLGDNIGITFCDGGENGSAPAFMVARPEGYDPGTNAEFKIVDSGEKITIYVDNDELVTIELYGLSNGYYTRAFAFDSEGNELFNGSVTVLEEGTIQFYQRNNHVVISDVSIYDLDVFDNSLPRVLVTKVETPENAAPIYDASFNPTGETTAVDAEFVFTAVEPTEEILADFGSWICDYRVTFDGAFEAESFGLYGAYADYKVAFPFPVAVDSETEPIYLLSLLGLDSHLTYNEIVTVVNPFNCGIFSLSEENVGKTINVEFVMWAPDATSAEAIVIAKKTYTFPLPVDEAHFPDANFRAYIVEQFGLVDRMYLFKSEYTTLEHMDVNSRNIATLRGIEYFTGLKTLTCYNNQLAELNLSKNTMLTNLDCANNQLSALDLSANHLLESIDCQNNRLLELDLDGLSEINTISCSNNLFKILDLSGKEKLVSLYYQSELLETLIIDGCSSLNYLPANTNGSLITFSARNCTSLSYVALYNNLLESIDLTGCTGLTSLDVSYNQLTELDLSGLSMLSDVSCYNNKIKNIRLEGCDSLANLNASNNKLKELDLLDCAMLREVYLWNNTTRIEIDISECTYLRNDYLKGRSVINGNCTVYTGVEVNEQNFPDAIFRNYVSTTVDTNGSTILSRKELNRIESIDLMNAGISSFEGLKYLDRIVSLRVSGNPIDALDLVGLERLAVLACQDTNVTELEISDCPNLVDAYVNGTVSSESTTYITYDSDFGYLAINRSIVISMGIPIDAEHFPDENFRSYVQNAFDLNTNGYLGQTERAQVTQINVSGRRISSLEGIFFFINTTYVDCSSNQLSSLDLSELSELEALYCSGNLLTDLDLSANLKLLHLDCTYNSILELDLSQNTSIRYLVCYRNGMTKLTILNCDKLIETIREGEKTPGDEYDYFHYNYDGEDIYLYLDKTLKISTGKEPAIVNALNSTLNGTVEMNVFLVLPDFILEDPGAYIKFSKDGNEKTVMVADVLDSPSIKDGVVRYVFSYEIVAKEFRDIVNVKLFDSTGRSIQLITKHGVDYGTDGYPYPLSRYLLDRINNSTNENMRNLARVMLDYGSAAQLYFNYNVDDSIVVTDAVSSIQYSEFDAYESVKSDDADKPDGFVKNTFSLVLEGDTALKMYYNFNSGYDPFSYQYYIDGEAATLHKEGEKYFLIVEDIVAKELDVAHEFTISDGTKSYTIISSALSYARYLAGLSDTNKQNLGKAILVYNRMAKDYFNSLSN